MGISLITSCKDTSYVMVPLFVGNASAVMKCNETLLEWVFSE